METDWHVFILTKYTPGSRKRNSLENDEWKSVFVMQRGQDRETIYILGVTQQLKMLLLNTFSVVSSKYISLYAGGSSIGFPAFGFAVSKSLERLHCPDISA